MKELQERQEEFDRKYWEHNEFGEKIRHINLHLGKLLGKISTYSEAREHGKEHSVDQIITEVVPDLLVYALQLSNLLGIELDTQYVTRLEDNVRRLHSKPRQPNKGKELVYKGLVGRVGVVSNRNPSTGLEAGASFNLEEFFAGRENPVDYCRIFAIRHPDNPALEKIREDNLHEPDRAYLLELLEEPEILGKPESPNVPSFQKVLAQIDYPSVN